MANPEGSCFKRFHVGSPPPARRSPLHPNTFCEMLNVKWVEGGGRGGEGRGGGGLVTSVSLRMWVDVDGCSGVFRDVGVHVIPVNWMCVGGCGRMFRDVGVHVISVNWMCVDGCARVFAVCVWVDKVVLSWNVDVGVSMGVQVVVSILTWMWIFADVYID